MKNLLFAILTILLIASCAESKEARELFAHVESVMNEYPDSAFAMLDSASVQKDSWSTREQMRYELLRAKAQNKAYIDFTTDSVMKEVAEYYDAHGTPNEQMEAHYLLGCTYRDLHESPMALSCYLDATEKADTLSDDCDYSTLMRIWGQVADEYDRQAMPIEELSALGNYQKYALVSCDTFNYIRGLELKIRPHFLLGDTMKVFRITNEANVLYKNYGLLKEANSVFPIAIYMHLSRNEFAQAKDLMYKFETNSGLFDKDGNIVTGREHYYNSKGMYYLGIQKYDSAKYFFEKLLHHGFAYDAYRGLVKLALIKGDVDSVILFANRCDISFDEKLSLLQTENMYKTRSLYDYSRNEKIALQEKEKANKLRTKTFAIVLLATISILALCTFIWGVRKKKNLELAKLTKEHTAIIKEYRKSVEDLKMFEDNLELYKKEKEQELHFLQEKLYKFSVSNENSNSQHFVNEYGTKSRIIETLNEKLYPNPNKVSSISRKEWTGIYTFIQQYFPGFYKTVVKDSQLTEQEMQIAILTRLGFSNSDVCILLNTTKSSVSNAKSSINVKLFDDHTARSFSKNISSLS